MKKLRYSIAGVLERACEAGGTGREAAFLIIGGLSLVISLFDLLPLPFDPAWVAIILCGVPIILEAVAGLITVFDIKADVLVSLALIASVAIGEDFAAGEVAFIMQLGALLEDLTVARARAGIERLVQLTPQTARRVGPSGEEIIAAGDVRVGDTVRVLPGESIPVDGVIISGETSVDQSVMTGESLPVDKAAGDEVSSGTVNRFGSFDMRATRVGEDSSIQRMVRLVQSADAGKAKIVGIADRWATWIVVIALTAAAITWLATGEMIRSVTILVVFCPCALVLATPTAIMAAIGNASKHGFLVREGDALERLSAVSRVCFDKTGTLTRGELRVAEVQSLGRIPQEGLLSLAAGAESRSEHPLGRAIVAGCRAAGLEAPECAEFAMQPGRGVKARAGGKSVLAGRAELLSGEGVEIPDGLLASAQSCARDGSTTVFLAVDGRAEGFIALADTLREDAAEVVDAVKAAGVVPVLLTGDHAGAAADIAQSVGIEEVHAECLPQDKLRLIGEYQAAGSPVCMLGDGINDAPALKRADTGIAMGGIGSDIAIDAADIALVNDDISGLPHLLRLSRRMMRTIRLNIAFSMGLNFLAITLAITGLLGPVVGALVHNAGSVLVIINSSLLLGWKAE